MNFLYFKPLWTNFFKGTDAVPMHAGTPPRNITLSSLNQKHPGGVRKSRMNRISSSLIAFKLRHGPAIINGPDFGEDAPKYTIAGSRGPSKPASPRPGPGEYNPSVPEKKLQTSFNKNVEVPADPLTSFIGYYRPPGMGDIANQKHKHRIHEKTATELFDIIETPGPSYNLPSMMDTKSHKIRGRESFIVEVKDIPPVGAYTPEWVALPKAPAFTVSPDLKKGEWLKSGADANPGPASYDVDGKDKATGYTFGNKSRGKRGRKAARQTLVIDRVVVNLSKFDDPDSVQRYVKDHLELTKLVNEIYEVVLRHKPENPIELIKSIFPPRKIQKKDLDEEFMSSDDFDLIDE